MRGKDGGMDAVGNADDGEEDLWTRIHLMGALPVWFGGESWGRDGVEGERVRSTWSGVMVS